MVLDLRLYSRVFGFFVPRTIRVYEPCVNIVCDSCGKIIEKYSYFARKPLGKGAPSRKNPNANRCRECVPFKVAKTIKRVTIVGRKDECKYIHDSYEKFQEICTPENSTEK